jgi:hypothetical protein
VGTWSRNGQSESEHFIFLVTEIGSKMAKTEQSKISWELFLGLPGKRYLLFMQD